MKKFLKNIFCIALSSVLILSSTLTGCGNHSASGDSDTQAVVMNPTGNTENGHMQVSVESAEEKEASSQAPSEPSVEKESSSQMSSESSGKKESPAQASSEKESSDVEKWAEYDNTAQGWGPGVNFNSKNQPEGALSYQKKYGSYRADFIGSDTSEKVIWLTMDEGYENGYTEKILDVLKEKDCQVVFFITGSYAKNNPDLIRRMISEGHVIGNHSWSHPSGGMPSLSVEDQISDITRLHDYVKEHYDYEMTLFRNPAGIFSERSLAVTKSLGYRSLFWSFAYADWDPDKQPDQTEALKKLVDRLHPGALYLLHAVSETNTAILGDFIDQARSQGYEFRLPE